MSFLTEPLRALGTAAAPFFGVLLDELDLGFGFGSSFFSGLDFLTTTGFSAAFLFRLTQGGIAVRVAHLAFWMRISLFAFGKRCPAHLTSLRSCFNQ